MLSIGEFSKLCRVSVKTLRHYDQIGLIKPIHTDRQTGYRYYEPQQLNEMMLILRLKSYRFSLQEIKLLIHTDDSNLLLASMREKTAEFEEELASHARLIEQMRNDMEKIKRRKPIMEMNHIVTAEEFRAVRLFGVRKMMAIAEFDAAFQSLFGKLFQNGMKPAGPSYAIYRDEENFNHENTDIELAVEVAQTDEKTFLHDPGLCCMTVHRGAYENLHEAYASLGMWMQEHGAKPNGAPFERYRINCEQTDNPENYETDVYYPIRYE